MDVVVQRIRTTWTKRSRGAPAAAVRNATPFGFLLPSGSPPSAHDVLLAESQDFATVESVVPVEDLPLELTVGDGRLRVLVEARFAMPPRGRHPAVRLLPGQWLRWKLNYRRLDASWHGEWNYELEVFNVAYGSVDRSVFLHEPDRLIDQLGYLR